jgi:hypothetical protein
MYECRYDIWSFFATLVRLVSVFSGGREGISLNWMITGLRFCLWLLNHVLNIYNIKEVGKNHLSKQIFWNHHAILL